MDVEDFYDKLEDLLEERYYQFFDKQKRLTEEVAFWRDHWFSSLQIPEKFSEDRKKRMKEILLRNDCLIKKSADSIELEGIFKGLLNIFDQYPN